MPRPGVHASKPNKALRGHQPPQNHFAAFFERQCKGEPSRELTELSQSFSERGFSSFGPPPLILLQALVNFRVERFLVVGVFGKRVSLIRIADPVQGIRSRASRLESLRYVKR